MYFLILLLGVFFYFLPSFVAANKKNSGAIFMANLLLGWTVFGWIICLIWAFVKD